MRGCSPAGADALAAWAAPRARHARVLRLTLPPGRPTPPAARATAPRRAPVAPYKGEAPREWGAGPPRAPPPAPPPGRPAARRLRTLRLAAASHDAPLPAWIAGLPRLEALVVDGETPPPGPPAAPHFLPLHLLPLDRLHTIELLAPGRLLVPPVVGELPALRRLAVVGAAGLAFHPAAFARGGPSSGVRDLTLDRCGLAAVPPAVCRLPGLVRLSLAGNRLTTLPALLPATSRSLSVLCLADNDLGRLPPALTRLGALTDLDLSGNARLQLGGSPPAPAPLPPSGAAGPAPPGAALAGRRDVSLAQLLAALPALARVDLRAPAGKRWTAASLAQLRLVGAAPGAGGKRGAAPGLAWAGRLLLPRAAGGGRGAQAAGTA